MANGQAATPGDFTIHVHLLNNEKPVDGMEYTLNQNVFFEKKNTELGGLSVGNFDFHYNGKQVDITVYVKFQFPEAIPENSKNEFKQRFFSSIESTWTNSGAFLKGNRKCIAKKIPINIVAIESEGRYHKLVDVVSENRRENVISDMNLDINTSLNTIAHEFGHVLGLYDEYDGGMIENRMFWHDNTYMADKNALMNSGTSLRVRYFNHIVKAVQSVSPPGCVFIPIL